jgi:hypothetical protein
MYYHVQLK